MNADCDGAAGALSPFAVLQAIGSEGTAATQLSTAARQRMLQQRQPPCGSGGSLRAACGQRLRAACEPQRDVGSRSDGGDGDDSRTCRTRALCVARAARGSAAAVVAAAAQPRRRRRQRSRGGGGGSAAAAAALHARRRGLSAMHDDVDVAQLESATSEYNKYKIFAPEAKRLQPLRGARLSDERHPCVAASGSLPARAEQWPDDVACSCYIAMTHRRQSAR
jgi:hypothetical protein